MAQASRARSVLPCPMCGTLLKFSLLEVEDEDAGTTDLLLLLDCPTGDYHGTLTQKDITKVLAAEVIRYLQNDGRRRAP